MKESMNYNRREVVAQQKRTRIAELKKRIILSCSFIALLAVAVVTAISFVNVNATVQGDNPSYKYYTSYEVQPGDTLTSIAQKYTANSNVSVPEYISEVKKTMNFPLITLQPETTLLFHIILMNINNLFIYIFLFLW